MDKLERIINLIALLLDTRRPLTAAEIRGKIPGYGDQSDETFHRMFERDKAEIRALGLMLEQEETFEGDHGYRIPQSEALLDDPGLEADEMAALSLAAQSWSGDRERELGFMKLAVGAGVAEPGQTGWLLPRVTVDRGIAALMDAVQRRKRVRFRYRTGGGRDVTERDVHPYALRHRGDWYLTGFDQTRSAVRHFKLSRVEGRVVVAGGAAADFDTPGSVPEIPHGPWEGEEIIIEARVAFAPEAAWWVERRTRARRAAERDTGWVELDMPVADLHPFAGWLAGFGDAAEAVAPDELREAVVAHLRAAKAG